MVQLTKPVGVVGLGLMGQAFVKRLDEDSEPVLGFDLSPQRCVELGEHRVSHSLSSLAKACSVIILSVFNTEQVEEAIFGKDGLMTQHSLDNPLYFICTSTCDPDSIKDIAKRCHDLGAFFLELPISGTSKQVVQGDCLGLMGGSESLCEELTPVLDIICPRRVHVGTQGDASRAKLAINLVLGLHRGAMAEGLNFGKSIGLDPEKLLPILQNSAAASSVMKTKGPLMVKRQYENPQSRVDQSLKDFGLIQQLGNGAQQHLPMTEIYIKLLQNCVANDESLLDNAIIFEAIARNALKKTK